MNINGIPAFDHKEEGCDLSLVLECTVDDALAMDTSRIVIATDEGDVVKTYAGYAKKHVTYDVAAKQVTLLCYLDTNGAGAAMAAFDQELTAEKMKNADLQAQVEEQAAAIEELASIIAEMEV